MHIISIGLPTFIKMQARSILAVLIDDTYAHHVAPEAMKQEIKLPRGSGCLKKSGTIPSHYTEAIKQGTKKKAKRLGDPNHSGRQQKKGASTEHKPKQ